MENKYHIYIDGNGYGFGNIGDDAILQGIIKILRSCPNNSTITVGVKDGLKMPFLESDISVIESFNFEAAKNSIGNSDFLVVGGGTMIGDELGLEFPLIYNVRRILFAKSIGKKIVLFGIGANRINGKRGEHLAKMMINLSDMVTLRDRESCKICRNLSKEKENVFQTADPAFLLEPKETERTKKVKELIKSKGKTIGINVVNEVWFNKKEYKKSIATVCNKLSKNGEIFPIFFSNEIRSGSFFDHEANKETASLLDCDYLILEPIYYSPEEMIDIISSFDVVLSMRMHGLIFSSIARVPFATISRIDKVDNFMNQFGLKPSGTVNNLDPDTLLEDIGLLINQKDQIINNIDEVINKIVNDCWKNQKYFTNIVNVQVRKNSIFDTIRIFFDRIYLYFMKIY